MRRRTLGLILSAWAWVAWLAPPCRADAPSKGLIRITSPKPGASVRGPLTFAARAEGLAGAASVEFRLDGRDLSGPLVAAPYRYPWHSSRAWDGPASVRAVARDAEGRVLAESDEVRFRVDNAGGRIRMVSPDPERTLRGKVRWEVEADRPLSERDLAYNKTHGARPDKTTEAIMFFVDGRMIRVVNGAKVAVELDTTELANGRHELFASAWAFAEGAPPFAMLRVPASVDNGRAPRRLRPRWRELRLAPGEAAELDPRLTFTDGGPEEPARGVRFASADPAVATVDEKGRVRGVKEGVTRVTAEADGRKATTTVVVADRDDFPHFARDGHILRRYEPGRSLFVRTMFGLGPDELERDRGLASRARAAGINALSSGFYLNPADARTPDLAAWRRGWLPRWERTERIARAHDFGLVLNGDDIARTRQELADSVGNPWSANAIQLAFAKARDSRRVIAVEMVDEVSFLWGSTPTPKDRRWERGKPPLPDDAFLRLMRIIDGVKARPPVSWPVGGISGPDVARNWMGDPAFSDYASHYWDVTDWRKAYPHSPSLPQVYLGGMARVLEARRPVLRPDIPSLMLVGTCGAYDKDRRPEDESPGGADALQGPGLSSRLVSAEVMFAAAAGMAGVRAYHFDTAHWKNERRAAKPGKGGPQVGADPHEVGTDRWQAMASSFRLIGHLEPLLLQPPSSAPDLGPLVYTGARDGPAGRLLIALNFSEAPEALRVDLGPYRFEGGLPVVRHRLVGASLGVDILPDDQSDSLTLAPGEASVWVFRPPSSGGGGDGGDAPPTVSLTTPSDSTVPPRFTATAHAADDKALKRVEFYVDGHRVASDESAPFACPVDLRKAIPWTWHGVTAIAHDASGHASEARIAVRVGRE